MTSNMIPTHTQVLVIGGGPAGSYSASALAREGLDVVLLEATQFPRYHIGESLLPSARHFLRFVGAEDKVVAYGFQRKPGAAFKLNQYKREGYTDFLALGENNNSWNVTRSDFDTLLLEHARASGVRVYERTHVTSFRFSDQSQGRPVSVEWRQTLSTADAEAPSGEISFDFVVDASGRAGLLSNRYMKNRHYNASLRNIALWGYWTGVGTYARGMAREGAPWFEALTDDSGWAWLIPLHDGTVSVGVVINQERHLERSGADPGTSMPARYLALLSLAPNLTCLIGEGTLMAKSSEGNPAGASSALVRSASDFSYSALQYAGEGFRIVGDAGAFIDPLFSSGVHLALTSALSAAASICASVRGDCSEKVAAGWHTGRFTLSYTRFQMIVLSTYKQIRATQFDVLNDVDEDGYERAFTFIRPVIQGASDMGRLSEQELQNALDYCSTFVRQFVHPMSGQDAEDVASAPSVSSAGSGKSTQTGVAGIPVEQANANARRVLQEEYLVHNLEAEVVDGFVMRLQRGSLGLSRVPS